MAFHYSYSTNNNHNLPTSSPSPPRARPPPTSHSSHPRRKPHALSSDPGSPMVDWDDADAYLSSDLEIDVSFQSNMSITSAPNSPTKRILPVPLPSRARNETASLDAVDPFAASFAPPPQPFERAPTRAPSRIIAGPASAYPDLGTSSSLFGRAQDPYRGYYESDRHHDFQVEVQPPASPSDVSEDDPRFDFDASMMDISVISPAVAIAPAVPRLVVPVPSRRRSNTTSMGSPAPFATNKTSTTSVDARPSLAEVHNVNSLLSSSPGGPGESPLAVVKPKASVASTAALPKVGRPRSRTTTAGSLPPIKGPQFLPPPKQKSGPFTAQSPASSSPAPAPSAAAATTTGNALRARGVLPWLRIPDPMSRPSSAASNASSATLLSAVSASSATTVVGRPGSISKRSGGGIFTVRH
ncbi:hypothetical protein DL93DRAFT_1698528 [Clavulina sp. PMI_390]|nr:hypothetical protein DL93DRAFT_1698528 [Clavulina sp. PMI_390]